MAKQFRRIKKDVHGVILLDKPTGMTSNKALQIVKNTYHARKAGHTGSLDPLATGLLPICLGQATKVAQYLLDSHKKYTTVIRLGETTDTLDSEGEIVETKPVDVSDQQIQDALEQFRGEIKQVPPMYSALKKDGQPLYKLARKGEIIDRPERDMTVHSLTAERIDSNHVRLFVHCSSGFYIRSLAHDLGQALACGAHVIELRRTEIKSIKVEEAVSLEDLEQLALDDVIQPVDCLIQDMPTIQISEVQAQNLLHGRSTSAEGMAASELSRLYTSNGELFGIGEVLQDDSLKTHRIFITSY